MTEGKVLLKKQRAMFKATFISFLAASLMLMLLPFGDVTGEGTAKALGYLLAGSFWIGILSGAVFLTATLIYTYKARKALKEPVPIQKKDRLPGIFSFFRNIFALIFDIFLFISLIFLAAIILFNISDQWTLSICMGLLLLSLISHSLFNGKCYALLSKYSGTNEER